MSHYPTSSAQAEMRSPFPGILPVGALKALEPCAGGNWAVTGQSDDSFSISYLAADGSELATYHMMPCKNEEQVQRLCAKHLYRFPSAANDENQSLSSPPAPETPVLENTEAHQQPESNMATEPPSFDQSTLVQDVFIQAPLEIQGHIQEEVQGNVQNAIQGNVQVDIQDNTQGVDVPPQADMMTFPEDRKIPSYFTDSSNISTIDSVGAYYDFGELPHIGGPVPNTENGGITSDPGALFNPDNEPFNPLLTESAWDQYGARETIESFFP